jgi:hypothetical protein
MGAPGAARPTLRPPMLPDADIHGLWLLKGERVVALTATETRLSGGLTFYRKGLTRISFALGSDRRG